MATRGVGVRCGSHLRKLYSTSASRLSNAPSSSSTSSGLSKSHCSATLPDGGLRRTFDPVLHIPDSSMSPVGADLGVQDFLRAVGKGVEVHAEKMATEAGSLPNFLRFRGGSLKGLGIPCQQRKLILRFIEKYRQGTWKPNVP